MSVCIWIWMCLIAAGVIAPGTLIPGINIQVPILHVQHEVRGK